MAVNFDEQIKTAEDDMLRNEEAMKTHRQEAIKSAAKWLAEWFMKHTETVALQYQDVTRSLGPEGVNRLKERVRKLQAAAPKIIAEFVDQNSVWEDYRGPHNNSIHGVNVRHGLKEALADAMGQLKNELSSMGYTEAVKNWTDHQRQRTYYPGQVSLPANVDASAKAFEDCANAWRSRRKNAADSTEAKGKYEAKTLWDEA